jgi:hypothetical protein
MASEDVATPIPSSNVAVPMFVPSNPVRNTNYLNSVYCSFYESSGGDTNGHKSIKPYPTCSYVLSLTKCNLCWTHFVDCFG